MPVGVAFRDGDLYVSAVSRILRLRDIEARLNKPPQPEVVSSAYPSDTHHGWKFIAFGPDGKLYVPVGAPCNICEPDPDRYAMITRLDVTSGKIEVVARGVRNTRRLRLAAAERRAVVHRQRPRLAGRRCAAGRAQPRCAGPASISAIRTATAARSPTPNSARVRRCAEFVPPVRNLGAHVASLGMRFYTGRQFPERYRNAVFIAEHGSWNRSRKTGYRVSVVRLQDGRAVSYEPFVTAGCRATV